MQAEPRVIATGPDAQPLRTDILDQVKADFLAGLNHEIRTPLSSIIGLTDLLSETDLSAEQLDYVSSTRACAQDLLEVLNTTLEYAALTAGTLVLDEHEFRLTEPLELAIAQHVPKARQKGLALCVTYDDSLPATVVGDARRLRQVISHLVGNAVKFTYTGQVQVRALHSNAEMSVVIEDTGIGIDPDKMALIFKSFHQLETGLARTYAGLGLGLAFSEKMAALLGGSIAVESSVGVGSRFTIRLPLHVPAAVEEPGRTAIPETRKSILVADDNRVAQVVISHVLKRNGYRVICVSDGIMALEAARREPFDLVLMDLQMPKMDGIEATTRLRELANYAQVPIIALTANQPDEFRASCERAGMQGFLTKPVLPSELIANVRRFV